MKKSERKLKERLLSVAAAAQSHPQYKAPSERRLRRRGAERASTQHKDGPDDHEDEDVLARDREREQHAGIQDHAESIGVQEGLLDTVIYPGRAILADDLSLKETRRSSETSTRFIIDVLYLDVLFVRRPPFKNSFTLQLISVYFFRLLCLTICQNFS